MISFLRGVRTLVRNLDRYDLGFWSLYEQSGTRLPMVASPFYHQLHIVQLRIMHRLTGEGNSPPSPTAGRVTHTAAVTALAPSATKAPSNSVTTSVR